jgi:beta-xylosidase
MLACEGEPGTPSSPDPTESASTPPAPAPEPALAFSHRPNPVRPGDFADPFILVADSAYYAFATNHGTSNVPVLRSRDLVTWTSAGDALPALPAWAVSGRRLTWAPSVLAVDGGYVLFFTARDRRSNLQCIGRAEASSPAGPFADPSAAPFLCQTELGGSIDASVVRDAAGNAYLLWKNDGNCCQRPVTLWSQRLDPPARALLGAPAPLLRRDRQWEGELIEAPTMWHDEAGWRLLYSANSWNTDRYAIGYARCDSPLGPCRKIGDGPVMVSDAETSGPGGAEVFSDRQGQRWVAYHGWTAGTVGYARGGARSLRLDRVETGQP